jgi:uncharacterized membrane protein
MRTRPNDNINARSMTACGRLKRRYAAGQITRQQYEQMRKDLE